MNPIDRGGKYGGHLVATIPEYYVCAECGSQIVMKYYSPTMDDAQCAQNAQHMGLRKKSDSVQSKAALAQQAQVLAYQEVQAIAKSNQQVAQLLKNKNIQSQRELWGDD